jgi:hypothetical protein
MPYNISFQTQRCIIPTRHPHPLLSSSNFLRRPHHGVANIPVLELEPIVAPTSSASAGPPSHCRGILVAAIDTTRNPLIHDEIPMTFLISSYITLHPWQTIIRSAGYEAQYEVQTLWRCANFVIDFVTHHTASMTIIRFHQRLAVLDMKPDMKYKHYDVAPISS